MPRNTLPSQDPASEIPETSAPRRPSRKWLFGILAVGISLPLIWLFFPVLHQALVGAPPPTPMPPTASPMPSLTATLEPTATLIPTVTSTPLPTSAYAISDPSDIYPPMPGPNLGAYLLNDDNAAIPDPGFEFPQWYTSDTIGQQLGVVISEPFHATMGNGSISWWMDVPVTPGLYEIFVLDTVYSSGGSLDFNVMLDGNPLAPILGRAHVDYQSSLSVPPQDEDVWHSIGTYSTDVPGVMNISTYWDARDKSNIVAVDRVLIVHKPDSIRNFIALLPGGEASYVVDDLQAVIDSNEIWFTRTDQLAWGDQFQALVNPGIDASVTWETLDSVPPGNYQVMIWSPAVSGSVEVMYKFLVNGVEAPQSLVVDLGILPGNQWVWLGNWNASSPDGSPVKIALKMEISGGSVGDVAIDAVAFIKMP